MSTFGMIQIKFKRISFFRGRNGCIFFSQSMSTPCLKEQSKVLYNYTRAQTNLCQIYWITNDTVQGFLIISMSVTVTYTIKNYKANIESLGLHGAKYSSLNPKTDQVKPSPGNGDVHLNLRINKKSVNNCTHQSSRSEGKCRECIHFKIQMWVPLRSKL